MIATISSKDGTPLPLSAGLVLPLSKCLVNRDSEFDRVVPGGRFSSVDHESLSWAKLGHPCRVITFESRARGYMVDMSF